MEMLAKIRRMYLRDKLSLHEIAKRTGLSRNTVREWLRKPTPNAKQAAALLRNHCRRDQSGLASRKTRASNDERAFRATATTRLYGLLRAGHQIHPDVAHERRQGGAGLRAAQVRAGRRVPIRLKRRRPCHRWRLQAAAGVAPEALRVPGLLACCVSKPGPRDAVRCSFAFVCRAGWHRQARHLRQYANSRRLGQQRQGPHR